jgi:hypothetical protein
METTKAADNKGTTRTAEGAGNEENRKRVQQTSSTSPGPQISYVSHLNSFFVTNKIFRYLPLTATTTHAQHQARMMGTTQCPTAKARHQRTGAQRQRQQWGRGRGRGRGRSHDKNGAGGGQQGGRDQGGRRRRRTQRRTSRTLLVGEGGCDEATVRGGIGTLHNM